MHEYGKATVNVKQPVHSLFSGLGSELDVWMSHGDKIAYLPPSFVSIASTNNAPFAGIAHENKPIIGIQFHPEVTHTVKGSER